MHESPASPAPPPDPTGAAAIAAALPTLPAGSGVYRMLDGGGTVLYVGKAKSLRKRVAAYAHPERLGPRIRRMVSETASLEVVTTHTEAEALLLEANLIKRLRPRYNILLRDDKSFPGILFTEDHPFPQVLKHRGARTRKGSYFGPFASGWAVNQTLALLQRAFLLRTCSDSVFAARTRPCLLYQIKRCSGPCVERISPADYAVLAEQARAFLTGQSQRIQKDLAGLMQAASDRLDFEEAAVYRDRLRALTQVQAHSDEVALDGAVDADVVAAHQEGGQTCVQVFFFRAGRNYGNRAYFPFHAAQEPPEQVLEAFLGQFYAAHVPPPLVLIDRPVPGQAPLVEALALRAGRRVEVRMPARGDKRSAIEHAARNAREALQRRLSESATQRRLLDSLAEALDLDGPPERIEIYDNSHIQGTAQVGAMVVAGPEGFVKAAYRKFNIKRPSAPGDDYAMMREVLTRRFARALEEDPGKSEGQWPDLVLIDGGPGQLSAALEVFAELGVEDVALAAVSKGPDRNAGRERVHRRDAAPLELAPRGAVLHFIQRLRDEAHRFAIGAHRARRSGGLVRSALDDVPGIGPKRKTALLHHFGSARAVADAGLADLEAVEGINAATAKKVYQWFHETD